MTDKADAAVERLGRRCDRCAIGRRGPGFSARRARALRCHAQTHLSQVYPHGSSVYSTFVFRLAPDFETNLERWRALKGAVSEAIVSRGGTITHQHGIGKDHARYLTAEKGVLGVSALRAMIHAFDPAGALDSGNLSPQESQR